MTREVWKVDIRDGHDSYHYEHFYHVFATNAAMAERKALAIARKDKVTFGKINKLLVYGTEFLCNVKE